MKTQARILIIAPVFFGDGSGACTYYKLLSDALLKEGISVSVISSRMIGTFSGEYYPLFPNWASKNRNTPRDILEYGVQNLSYLWLYRLLTKISPESVIVHTGFMNHPGIFGYILRYCIERKGKAIKWIADVRDSEIRLSNLPILTLFNNIIACSLNVKQFLINANIDENKIVHIPIPQEKLYINEEDTKHFLNRIELQNKKYILYYGRISIHKSVDLIFKAFFDYVAKIKVEYKLVVCGLLKSTDQEMIQYLKNPKCVYLGNQNRDDILKLVKGSALCINVSKIEGLPRSSLEPLSLRVPVILPPGVPEFEEAAPDFVCHTEDPYELSKLILKQLDNPCIATYNIEEHLPDRVVDRYLDLII